MEKIKTLTCPCGEEVYEDDKNWGVPEDGLLYCINCGTKYCPEDLKEVDIAYNFVNKTRPN